MAPPFGNRDLAGIQGDILLNGFPKKAEIFLFFTIRSVDQFRKNIQNIAGSKIATGKDIKDLRAGIAADKEKAEEMKTAPVPRDVAKTNIAFTFKGLRKLGNIIPSLEASLKEVEGAAPAFSAGMQDENERKLLGDPVVDWGMNKNGGGSLDGVLIVAGLKMATVENEVKNLLSLLNAGGEAAVELGREVGFERAKEPGHEHFGFNDGISHPLVIGINSPTDKLGFTLDDVKPPTKTNNSVNPGIILVGRNGDREKENTALSGITVQPKPQWMKDGSFLVFRKLEQHVDRWQKFTSDQYIHAGCSSKEQFAAQLMGRWPSGCPLTTNDKFDEAERKLDNDFSYGDIENTQISEPNTGYCPVGAHIRKAHVRAKVERSRIMRRGIPYGDDFQPNGKDEGRGLLFAAYQSTIEDGYRFIQALWANEPDFPVRNTGFDVVFGQGTRGQEMFTVGANEEPIKLEKQFVEFKGGEYFFAPSMSVLKAGFDIKLFTANL